MATKVVRGQLMTFIATPKDSLNNVVSPSSVTLYVNYPHAGGVTSTDTVAMGVNTDGTWEAEFDTSVAEPGALFCSVQAEGPSAGEDLKFTITANAANPDFVEPPPPTPPSYSYVGIAINNPGNSGTNPTETQTASFDLGAAAADRVVIVGMVGAVTIPASVTCSVAGVSLTKRVEVVGAGGSCIIFSGTVPTGAGSQSLTLFATGENYRVWGTYLWVARGLSTGYITGGTADHAEEHGNHATVTLSANAGDFIFAVGGGNDFPNVYTFDASSEAPDATDKIVSYYAMTRADWTVDANNASFLVDLFGGNPVAVVLFR